MREVYIVAQEMVFTASLLLFAGCAAGVAIGGALLYRRVVRPDIDRLIKAYKDLQSEIAVLNKHLAIQPLPEFIEFLKERTRNGKSVKQGF